MKRFNITGVCVQSKHYMVDINDKLVEIEKLIRNEEYFTINRSRQYGKTTTLSLLEKKLSNDYIFVRTSFEGIGGDVFESEKKFCNKLLDILASIFRLSNFSIFSLNALNNCF